MLAPNFLLANATTSTNNGVWIKGAAANAVGGYFMGW